MKVNIVTEARRARVDERARAGRARPGTRSTDVVIRTRHGGRDLEGRAEVLESIIARRIIQVFVDCVGLDPAASYELPVQVHLPVSDWTSTRHGRCRRP